MIEPRKKIKIVPITPIDNLIKPQVYKTKSNSNPSPVEYKKRSTRLEKIKSTFLYWSKNANIDSYSKIFQYERNPCGKLFFTFILIISLVLTCLLLSSNVNEYLRYEIVTSIEKIYEIPSEFPTVTICHVNPFKDWRSAFIINDVMEENNMSGSDAFYTNENFIKINELAKMKVANPAFNYSASFNRYDSNTAEDKPFKREHLGFFKYEIEYCHWKNKNRLYANACFTNLHQYYSYQYGNCYQFNSGFDMNNHPIELAKTTASSSGDDNFHIQIRRNKDENKNFSFDPYADGFVVFIHNKSFEPTYGDGVFVKTGEYSSIAVKRTFIHKEPYPYSECSDLTSYKSELYDFILSLNRQVDMF